MDDYAEITPEELQSRLAAGRPPEILDVREPWEHELCALPGARLVPMEELPFRLDELQRDRELPEGELPERELVVYCHHGIRSAAVVQWLRRQGIPALNLRGGIDAWALAVDPSLRRY